MESSIAAGRRPARAWRAALIACTLALGATAEAGMWEKMSDAERVERSEVVVVGTLAGRTTLRTTSAGPALNLGVIVVDEVLKAPAGEPRVVLLALRPADAPIASSDIAYRDGQRGLWFLRAADHGPEGAYVADHPQRFVPMEHAAALIDSLRAAARR